MFSHTKPVWATSSQSPVKMRHFQKRHNFQLDLVDFLINITLHCYHWMIDAKRSISERILWIVIHIIGAVSIITILNWTLEQHMTNPFVTTLHDTAYPISQIGFPGISVCSSNLMSKRRAQAYAKHLAAQDSDGHDEAFFLKGVQNLAKLYDFDAKDPFDFVSFQHILERLDENFDVADKLKALSPQCDEILLRCVWNGNVENCTDENKMFRMMATATGHCCVFNSKHIYDNAKKTLSASSYSSVSGLILYMNALDSDYFYSRLPFVGVRVQVYNPGEISDPSTGIVETLISVGTESLIKLTATVTQSDDNIRRYSIEKRGCRFQSDMNNSQPSKYYRSNCIRACRLNSINALCECIPFFEQDASLANTTKPCTLGNVPCLSHHNVKWLTPLFLRDKDDGVEMEFENGLSCLHCLPSCSQTQYSISTTRLPLRTLPVQAHYLTHMSGTSINELILLRIFYAKPDHYLYRQYIAKNWFELLSELGGMCGVIIGFSLISAVEVAYFVVRQFYLAIENHYRRRYSAKVKHPPNNIFFT